MRVAFDRMPHVTAKRLHRKPSLSLLKDSPRRYLILSYPLHCQAPYHDLCSYTMTKIMYSYLETQGLIKSQRYPSYDFSLTMGALDFCGAEAR
jgi:hypothetical protein